MAGTSKHTTYVRVCDEGKRARADSHDVAEIGVKGRVALVPWGVSVLYKLFRSWECIIRVDPG